MNNHHRPQGWYRTRLTGHLVFLFRESFASSPGAMMLRQHVRHFAGYLFAHSDYHSRMQDFPYLQFALALAALWHTLAFAAGAVFVYFSYRSVFGEGMYEPRWGRIIRNADLHLWLSGFALIALGIIARGMETYLANPKLLTKVSVVVVWFLSTQYLRFYALPRFRGGQRGPMLLAISVSLGCWVYGAFLGCAKGLAYGAAPFGFLAAGFILTLAGAMALTSFCEARWKQKGKQADTA